MVRLRRTEDLDYQAIKPMPERHIADIETTINTDNAAMEAILNQSTARTYSQ